MLWWAACGRMGPVGIVPCKTVWSSRLSTEVKIQGLPMSDSQRNVVLAACGVALVFLVAGFMLGLAAGKPPAETYSVYSHSTAGSRFLNLVRHNRQTGKTEYAKVDTLQPKTVKNWKAVSD